MFNPESITLEQIETFEEITGEEFAALAAFADQLQEGAMPPARILKGIAYLASTASGKPIAPEELGKLTIGEITRLMTEMPETPTAA